MIPQVENGIKYYQFTNLRNHGVTQRVFTRLGGKSHSPWDSLNVGSTVGDDPAHVKSNLEKILNVTGYQKHQLTQVRQVHSADVVTFQNANWANGKFPEADAMISNQAGLLLLMRFADCVPILIYDPGTKAVAIAHSGWKGTVKKIGLEVVRAMQATFNSNPEDLLAGIGPSIGPDHYQIGEEVIDDIQSAFIDTWEYLLQDEKGAVYLNLWKANALTLESAGVKNIEIAKICTSCSLDEWFSHRGDNGKTGRFAAVIGLTNTN